MLGTDTNFSTGQGHSSKMFDLRQEEAANQKKVSALFHSNKSQSRMVRILPARDLSGTYSSNDPALETSVMPYREARDAQRYNEDQTPKFTPWAVKLGGYRFIGNNQHNILSPMNRNPKDGDPLVHMHTVASASTNQDWLRLTQPPATAPGGGFRKPLLPHMQYFGYLNVYHWDPTDPSNQKTDISVLRVPWITIEALWKTLSYPRPGTIPEGSATDPEWPEYFLGDITSPDHGSVAFLVSEPMADSKSPIPTAQLKFIKDWPHSPKLVGGKWPLPEGEFRNSVLQRRNNIWDADNGAFYIPTYEEVVKLLVDDGFYPTGLIVQACGPHCDLPAGITSGATYSHGQGPAANNTPPPAPTPPQQGGGYGMPGTPAPAPTPPAPAPTPPQGGNPPPPPGGMGMAPPPPPQGGNPPSGGYAPPAPTAPPQGGTPPATFPPQDNTGGHAEAAPSTPAASNNSPMSALTPEEKARYDELLKKLHAGEDLGSEMSEFTNLSHKLRPH